MYILGTFKIKIESQNSEYECIKDKWPSPNKDISKSWIMDVSKAIDHIQIKFKIPKPSQEPPASSKAQNQDSKCIDDLCTFIFKSEGQKLDHVCIKDQWPYPNQDKDPKSQSGTSSILQCPKLGLERHGCSLHLQNQDRKQQFRTRVYQGPETIIKSRSRFRNLVRNLQHPPAPNLDFKDMDVHCTFKIKINSQSFGQGVINDQWSYPNQDKDPKPKSGTSRVLLSPESILKGHDVHCTFKIKIKCKTLDHGYIKDKQPNQNQDQDPNPQSGNSKVLQCPKSGIKGHLSSLYFQNQER